MEEGLPIGFVLTKRKRLRLSKSLLLRMRGMFDKASLLQRMIASASLMMEAMGDGDGSTAMMGPFLTQTVMRIVHVTLLGKWVMSSLL
jgi:hypothetical protein